MFMSDSDKVNLRRQKLSLTVACWFLTVIILAAFYIVVFKINSNFRRVVDKKVYRSGQPSVTQLKKWVQLYGIKTIINLRGSIEHITKDEENMAKKLGVTVNSIHLSAKRLPARYLVVQLIETIENAELPLLIHCRSGIDRAGVASAIASMAIGKVDYDTAKWQAYVPPGPWKRKRYSNRKYFHDYHHISDIFKLYERDCRQNRLDTNDWKSFRQWVSNTPSLPKVEPI